MGLLHPLRPYDQSNYGPIKPLPLHGDVFKQIVTEQLDEALKFDLVAKRLYDQLCYAAGYILPYGQHNYIKKLNDLVPLHRFTINPNTNVQPYAPTSAVAGTADPSTSVRAPAATTSDTDHSLVPSARALTREHTQWIASVPISEPTEPPLSACSTLLLLSVIMDG